MKILIDLNVILDVLQKREPHYTASSIVLSKVLTKDIDGYLPGHALTTIFYITHKFSGREKAFEVIDWLLVNFKIVTLEKADFIRARSLQISDFEDAVVASLAESADCDYIVTRNTADFKKSPIAIATPIELIETLTMN